ncbi:MAG: hypothetical protein FWD76_05595, partial [Firmicutes bacterium]|nr:hypothetical protein [Bacillota bacterium]
KVTRPPPGARSPYSSYNSLPPPPNALPMSRSYMVHSQTFNENQSQSYGNALRSQVRTPYDQPPRSGKRRR